MRRYGTIAVTLLLLAAAPAATQAQQAFSFVPAETGHLSDLGQLAVFHTLVTNTGSVADTYDVVISKQMPAGWTASLCEGGICYAPFIEHITFSLAPGAESGVDIDLTPLTTAGGGSVTVTVTSQGAPALSEAADFVLVTPGLDVLLVDGSGQAGLAAAYETALAGAGRSYAAWPRAAAGALAGTDLGGFAHVVWFDGPAGAGLDDADRGALAYYVQHGGSLFLSGQDLAWQVCDPASPDYAPAAAAWFPMILGAGYSGPGAAFASAAGVAGNATFDGLVLALQGGDGAGGNTSCDVLAADGGTGVMLYGPGQVAAVRHAYGTGVSLFCAFGLESVATAAQRQALMDAFFATLNEPTGVPAAPVAHGAVAAAPNPFNPRTELRFTVPTHTTGAVTVDILDARGRLVRRLWNEPLAAGDQALAWDGRDGQGRAAGAGVYVALVRAGTATLTGKLVLAK